MPDQSKHTPATDAVKALARFLSEPDVEDRSDEEIRDYLRNANVDINRVRARVAEDLAKARARSALANARCRRESFLDRITGLRLQLTGTTNVREQVRAFLDEVFTGQPDAAVAWRNFEQATDDDLLTMVEDLNLLEELTRQDEPSPPGS